MAVKERGQRQHGLGATARGRIGATELNDIVARAEGNAYYAEELLAASVTSDRAQHSILPAGLAALLLNRVEQLSDATQQVLRAAAVAGRKADDELVRAASGLGAAEYEGAVREAVTHQLLVPDGTEGYVFRHALLREAVYADLLPGERTRLHATFCSLLADEQRLMMPGTAAELAQHCLASHDIPGAFAASVRAGDDAEQLGAPAEAHRHYDQALALWERVTEPEKTAGMARGKLGLLSATNAADSGDVERAVHLLRRLRQVLATQAEQGGVPVDVKLASRIGERLAFNLMLIDDPKAATEAAEVARATVDATPADPPTWQYARALTTYAYALLMEEDFSVARDWAQRGIAAARAADAPWVEADAFVTLGFMSNREGRNDEAIKLLTAAHKQAREAMVLGVEPGQIAAGQAPLQKRFRIGGMVVKGSVARSPGDLKVRFSTCLLTAGNYSTCTSSATTRTASGIMPRRSPTVSRFGSPARPRPTSPRWLCSLTSRAATRRCRSGATGSSRSGRSTDSTRSSRMACSPSTLCGKAIPSRPWPRAKPRSSSISSRRGATPRRSSGPPRSP